MKKHFLLILLFIFLAALPAKAETISVTVQGMVCGFCAHGIQKNFSKSPAVDSIAVNLETKTIVIQTKKNATLKDEEIRAILLDAGYNTSDIKRQP